jgi:cellulose synthase/poly-beta-1,6-N-acetylglucosamine synthase-like glycosyltransferase
MIILEAICWISLLLIIHTYLLFPALLSLLARNKRLPATKFPEEKLPFLSILIAAYNEEKVLEEKIRSVLEGDYPGERMEILVGSDASTDGTNRILETLAATHSMIRPFFFEKRTGKPGIINQLAEASEGSILVITDANVLLDRDTLRKMTGPFSDPGVGLVDSMMINTHMSKDGISQQERFYISREVQIKHHESLIWGAMMGPFGGCYAVRRELFRPVPGHFLVDDFFINMSVLRQGFRCISHTGAKVFEDVSNDLWEEFRRKKRISAGNFQNLKAFKSLLIKGPPGVPFCFFSHKVVRWLVPFLVLITLSTSLWLGTEKIAYRILAFLQLGVLAIPVIDLFLRKIKIHALPLRFISHFVWMNVALLAGFIRFLGGIQSNVWQPTRRNQHQAEHH